MTHRKMYTETPQWCKDIFSMAPPPLLCVALNTRLDYSAQHEKAQCATTMTSRRLMQELIVASPATFSTTDPLAPNSWLASLPSGTSKSWLCNSARPPLCLSEGFCCLCGLSPTLARSQISLMESWHVSWHLHGAMEHMDKFRARARGNTQS